MDKSVPNNTILMLSGVSCVGKTTTAFNIIKKYSEFKVVTELDIIRTAIRDTIININDTFRYYDKNNILKEYSHLFDSLTDGTYDILLEQAKLLLPCIRKIVYRQQNKKIPTIIEGMSIVPELYFDNFVPIDGFKENVIFINLYISNKNEHIKRRMIRCEEREYNINSITINDKINKMQIKNLHLHNSTLNISNKNNKVYSIDVSYLNENEVADEIMKIIYNLFF